MKTAFGYLPFSQSRSKANLKTDLQSNLIEPEISTMRERSDSQTQTTKRWKMTPLLRLDSQGEVTGAKQFCDRPPESHLHQMNHLDSQSQISKSYNIAAQQINNSLINDHIPFKSFKNSLPVTSQTFYQPHPVQSSVPATAMSINFINNFSCPAAKSFLHPFSSKPRILGSVNIFGPQSSLPCDRGKRKNSFSKNMNVCDNVQQNSMDVLTKKGNVMQSSTISKTMANAPTLNTIVKQNGFSVPSPIKVKDPEFKIDFEHVNNVNISATSSPVSDNSNNNVIHSRKKKRKRQRSRKRGHKSQTKAFHPTICSSPVKESDPLENMDSESETPTDSVLVACTTTVAPANCKNVSECQTFPKNNATALIFSSPSDTEPNDLLTSDSEHDSISICHKWRDGTLIEDEDDDLTFNDSDSHDSFLIFQGSSQAKPKLSKQKSKTKKELKRHIEETSDDSDLELEEKSEPSSALRLMIGVSISEDEDYDSSIDWGDLSTSPGSAVSDQFIFEFEFNTGLSLDSLVGQTPSIENQIPVSQEMKDINAKWNNCYACCPNTSSRKAKNSRKVQFAEEDDLKTVHIVGDEDRAGEWQQFAVERAQFKHKIDKIEKIIAPVLCENHRARIVNRFLVSN